MRRPAPTGCDKLPKDALEVQRRPAMKKRSSSRQNPKSAVKAKRAKQSVTIGMDLGDKTSRYCLLSEEGEIVGEGQVATTKARPMLVQGAHYIISRRGPDTDRKLVQERTRYSNRLTAHLKMYFPQVLHWFEEIGSSIAADFLIRWPSLEILQRARSSTIERFFADHNSRNRERIRERLEQIRKAVAATHDQAVVTSGSVAVVAWAGLLTPLLKAIQSYDEQIARLARQHPDYALMNSFPGAGPVLTPRLIAALGTQRDRYQSAHELQCYIAASHPWLSVAASSDGCIGDGHAPSFCGRPSTNGRFTRSRTRRGPASTTRSSAKGKSRHAAIRSLAFKWIRILFRCWKQRQPYDELVYQRALAARRPKVQSAAQPVELQWKNVARFSKIVIAGD